MPDSLIVVGLALIVAYTGYAWGRVCERIVAWKASAQEKRAEIPEDLRHDTLAWMLAAFEAIESDGKRALSNGVSPESDEAKRIVHMAAFAQDILRSRLEPKSKADSDGP